MRILHFEHGGVGEFAQGSNPWRNYPSRAEGEVAGQDLVIPAL